MTFSLQGKPALAVGIPTTGGERGVYFELVELDDLQRTAGIARGVSLLGASLFTTLAGAGIGYWAAVAPCARWPT